ncbi:SAM-dependent methyltransferase [Dactylosporangium sp. CA-052675]|uniref:SAM-dependent methyltransferase n=1 Tax=Dactylosporangium sp. CA-052675 TaxID=3239927 RepID=UPI003D8F3F24
MDLPRIFAIREADHRIHNPLTEHKLATLGAAVRLRPGQTLLDLACGSGEMLCTWSRDHGIRGTGVDISTVFLAAAEARAAELGVAGRVRFVHADAAGFVLPEPVDVAACIGATWIGDGLPGTLTLLERSLKPGGLLLVGEPFWRVDHPDQAIVEGCGFKDRDEYDSLPGLVESFGRLGWDVVEMVLADEDSWDRYAAAQWFSLRAWLDANPGDELAGRVRAELDTAALRYVRYRRPYLGWGVFALRRR